jgi:hypothetical protein
MSFIVFIGAIGYLCNGASGAAWGAIVAAILCFCLELFLTDTRT